MSTKIVFVNRFFHPDISATSQMATDLACDLADTYHVHVITSTLAYDRATAAVDAATTERLRHMSVHRIWTSAFGRRYLAGRAVDYLTFYLSACLRLTRLVKRGDVIVCMTDPPLLSVPVLAVTKLKRAVLVNWLQDVFPEIAVALDFRSVRRFIERPLAWLRDRSLSGAARNVAVGDVMAARIRRRGLSDDQVTVILNWASADRIAPVGRARNRLREKWGLGGRFVVGYSGNFGRAHDFGGLLEAMARLRDRTDIVFLLIGGGSQRKRLEAEVRARQLENVMFQPYQPNELLSESLAAADCHVVSLKPSLEGLVVPSKVYAAMAAGRPIIFIGARDGEIARMLHDGPMFGLCVPPDDIDGLVTAIEQLADDPLHAERLGRTAREWFNEKYERRVPSAAWRQLLDEFHLSVRTTHGDEESIGLDVLTCPGCGAAAAYRSRAKSIAERARRDLGTERLYRCHACGWRGWLQPLDSGGRQAPADVPSAPDLSAIDSSSSLPETGRPDPAFEISIRGFE